MSNLKKHGPLTGEQHRTMILVCQGRTHREICDLLNVSRQTVSDRVQAATHKMGCLNSAGAAAQYAQWMLLHDLLRHGHIEPSARGAIERRARMLVPTVETEGGR